MALKQRLVGMCASMLLFAHGASAQFVTTEANQSGILLFDAVGQFFSAPIDENQMGPFIFKEMQAASGGFNFGLPLFKDFAFVADPQGEPIGAYALDILGGQYALTRMGADPQFLTESGFLPSPVDLGVSRPHFYDPLLVEMEDEGEASGFRFRGVPYFQIDAARNIEIAPDWRLRRHGYSGYFVLDADGVVHSVGFTNQPYFAYGPPGSDDPDQAILQSALFPNHLDVSGTDFGSINVLNKDGVVDFPVNYQYHPEQINSVTPIYTYFGQGSNIARDLEVSSEFVQMTAPWRNGDGSVEERLITIAMTNGYYIMDGYGAVHSNLLALDFDTNNDQAITYADLVTEEALAEGKAYNELAQEDLHPHFGMPINKAPLAEPWFRARGRGDLPYFVDGAGRNLDLAVAFELTPSGRGFYLLDAFGGVHAVGDAHFTFPPSVDGEGQVRFSRSRTPYYGFGACTNIALITNAANEEMDIPANRSVVGYLVLDGFGTVNVAGIAQDYDIASVGNQGAPIFSPFLSFRSLGASPIWTPGEPRQASVEEMREFLPLSGPFTASTRFKFRTATGVENSQFAIAPGFRHVTAAFTRVSPVSVSRPQAN